MEIMRNDEIDLTLDEDSVSINSDSDDRVEEGTKNKIEGHNIDSVENNETAKRKPSVDVDIGIINGDKKLQETHSTLIDNYLYNDEVSKLIKVEEKLENGEYIKIYSCGPIQQQENKVIRPINCHACRFTTVNFDEMKTHIESEEHKNNILYVLPEKKHQCAYNLYDDRPKEFKIMICIFGGENITEVHEENKNRLVYFCKSTHNLKVQKIVLNMTKKDILVDINKQKPLLGLEYCIKFINNFSYYCVLCNEHILKDPLIHFNGKSHMNNFIVRHFLLTRDKIETLLKKSVDDITSKNESIEAIILIIYGVLEKKYKLQKINVIEQKMFNCFRNYFVKIVCNRSHYSDEKVAQIEIKSNTKDYIERCKQVKLDLSEYEDNSEAELVVINDEQNSKNLPINEIQNSINLGMVIKNENELKSSNENSFLEDVTVVSDQNDTENEEEINKFIEQNPLILKVEKEFTKLEIILDLQISNYEMSDMDAYRKWKKSTYGVEYICRYKFHENGREIIKFKCILCDKFFPSPLASHTSSNSHRMRYIDKHFPILKSYLQCGLSEMNFDNEKQKTIIGQMIAEICHRLRVRSNRNYSSFFRVYLKKFSVNNQTMNAYLTKQFENKQHYNDQLFVSVYKEKLERTKFLKNLLKRFIDFYNKTQIYKRKQPNNSDIEDENLKRAKICELTNVPITLISVLKLIATCSDLDQVRLETNRLLTHAEEMENVNGNITELMKSVEYLNFFKRIMAILKNIVENSDANISNEKMTSINQILDKSTLLVESMEDESEIEMDEPIASEVLTIDDDDEPEFISSSDTDNGLKKLPNPFNSKFKKPIPKSNVTAKTNQHQNFPTAYSANRNIVNNEIRVNNRNIGQPFMNINRPNSSILTMNPNRYNNNPVLNVTTYSETTQMSIPILGNTVNNSNQFRNVFVNNQQNHHHRYQNANINFSSYASRATSVQQSTLRAPSPAITQQSTRTRILPSSAIPIVLSTSSQSSAAAQNSIFNARINFRASIPPQQPTPSPYQHVSISNNRQVHNFNNMHAHGNTLSITQRFQAIRPSFSLNNSFPGVYGNTRNMFAGRTHF